MLNFGLLFLFGTFSQAILTIIAYQFYFRYAINNGGIGGNIISNIHPLIFAIIIVEVIIALALISKGIKNNEFNR